MPSQLDIHCYVVVERLIYFEKTCYKGAEKMNVKENLPTVCAYVARFSTHELFKDVAIKVEAF